MLCVVIEKCSSPIGDGNSKSVIAEATARLLIEKCSSPIGDGNCMKLSCIGRNRFIEKCSSPIGDGNDRVENCM